MTKHYSSLPSRLLTPQQNEGVFKALQKNCTSLVTSVAILYAYKDSGWVRHHIGILCIERDDSIKKYFLRYYNSEDMSLLIQQKIKKFVGMPFTVMRHLFFQMVINGRTIAFEFIDTPAGWEEFSLVTKALRGNLKTLKNEAEARYYENHPEKQKESRFKKLFHRKNKESSSRSSASNPSGISSAVGNILGVGLRVGLGALAGLSLVDGISALDPLIQDMLNSMGFEPAEAMGNMNCRRELERFIARYGQDNFRRIAGREFVRCLDVSFPESLTLPSPASPLTPSAPSPTLPSPPSSTLSSPASPTLPTLPSPPSSTLPSPPSSTLPSPPSPTLPSPPSSTLPSVTSPASTNKTSGTSPVCSTQASVTSPACSTQASVTSPVCSTQASATSPVCSTQASATSPVCSTPTSATSPVCSTPTSATSPVCSTQASVTSPASTNKTTMTSFESSTQSSVTSPVSTNKTTMTSLASATYSLSSVPKTPAKLALDSIAAFKPAKRVQRTNIDDLRMSPARLFDEEEEDFIASAALEKIENFGIDAYASTPKKPTTPGKAASPSPSKLGTPEKVVEPAAEGLADEFFLELNVMSKKMQETLIIQREADEKIKRQQESAKKAKKGQPVATTPDKEATMPENQTAYITCVPDSMDDNDSDSDE